MAEELHVEISNGNLNDVSLKWYDVSQHVISGKETRGRSYEIDDIETGTASLEFENTLGMFTPGRTSITVFSERFNAFGNIGEGNGFTLDSGTWKLDGSGVTGHTVTCGPNGVVSTGTLSNGSWMSVEMADNNRAIPVTPGATVTVSYAATSVAAVRGSVTWGSDAVPVLSSSLGAVGAVSDTYTVPVGATYAKVGVRAEQSAGVVSLTVKSVKVSLPNPFAGTMEPGRPIREYVIADSNWVHYQCVTPKYVDGGVPRFWNSSTTPGYIPPKPTVKNDSTLGRDVFEAYTVFGGSSIWGVGFSDQDAVAVKTGQTVTVSALVSNVNADDASLIIYTNGEIVASTPIPGKGTYSRITCTWVATSDKDVWAALNFSAGIGITATVRVTDLKLALGDNTAEAVAVGAISGRFPVFRGVIEMCSQGYSGNRSTVTVECVDAMASLAQPMLTKYRGAVEAWYQDRMRPIFRASSGGNFGGAQTGAVFCYWPCVEREERSSVDPVYGPYNLNVYPGKLPGSSSAGFTDTKTMVYADGMESGSWTVTVDDAASGTWAGAALSLVSGFVPSLPGESNFFDVDFWFIPEALPPSGTFYNLWGSSLSADNAGESYVRVNSSGGVEFKYMPATSGNGSSVASSNGVVVPGVPIHIGFRVTHRADTGSSGNVAFIDGYIDGNKVNAISQTVTTPYRYVPRFERMTFAQDIGTYGTGGRTFYKPMRGSMNHIVATWGSPTGLHTFLHSSGTDITESETGRLNRILDIIGWKGPRRMDSAASTLLSARWNLGDDAGELLKGAAESAGGVFYVDTSGAASYQNRYRRINPPVQWTVYEWAEGLRFQLDYSRVRNEIRAERSTGLIRTARDDDSIDRYGYKSLTVTRDVSDPDEVAHAASWILHRHKDAVPWCDTLRVDAHTLTSVSDVTLKALAYGADISQRLLMVDLPPDAPADECDFFIEGVETEFVINGGVLEWTATFSVSDVGNSRAWVIEDPSTGVLDVDDCVLTY